MASRKPAAASSKRSRLGAASPFGFLLDCEAVVGLRLLRIAGGGALARRESIRMVGEKFEAALEAQVAVASAILGGRPEDAFDLAASAYHRRVRANRRRLAPS